MEVKRLKVENDTVLVSASHNGKWAVADKTHISSLQTVLRRLESRSFVDRSIREDVEFKREFSVGTGSVKSFKDEDGDFICTYETKAKETPGHIDEDLEFEQVDSTRTVEPVNLWEAREKALREETMRSSAKETQDSKFSVPKLPLVRHPTPNYQFQKRSPCTAESAKYRKGRLVPRGVAFEPISYVRKAKWTPTRRMDGDLIKAILQYNQTHGIRDEVEKEFYLRVKKTTHVPDEEFERLLRAVVNYK